MTTTDNNDNNDNWLSDKYSSVREDDISKWRDRLVLDHRFYKPELPLIYWFYGEYRFLSNFFYVDHPSPSTEHHYQAAKVKAGETFDFMRDQILNAKSAGEAKKLGGNVPLREDWERVKDDVMRFLVAEKFTANEELKQKLLQTGDAYLIEGTTWHDNVWGICIKKDCEKCSKIKGLNRLGVILMEQREILRKTNG